MTERSLYGSGIGRKSLIFAENVLYWAHYKPNPGHAYLWSPWVPVKLEQGRGSFRAQAVSQKTRKKSVSKSSKKAAAPQPSATKSRARASLKDTRKATKASAGKY